MADLLSLSNFGERLYELRWLLALMLVAMLLIAGWVGGVWRNRRRRRTLFAVLEDSVRGHLLMASASFGGGFTASIEPAPEPFARLNLQTHFCSPLNIIACLRSLVGIGDGRMALACALPTHPNAELTWKRDQIPGRALSFSGNPSLWARRALDFTGGEYAVRGTNTRAIEHTFVELQARFSPHLTFMSIQADRPLHLQLELELNGLNDELMPMLVTLIRASGRASMVR